MIEPNPSAHSWLLTCDRCGRLEELRTAQTEGQVAPKAARLGWEMASPHGDLCPKCARKWRTGLLDDEKKQA